MEPTTHPPLWHYNDPSVFPLNLKSVLLIWRSVWSDIKLSMSEKVYDKNPECTGRGGGQPPTPQHKHRVTITKLVTTFENFGTDH